VVRRFARSALTMLAAGAAVAIAACGREPDGARAELPFAHVDAPLAFVSCESIGVKPPDPEEVAADERSRPYHLLVRTLSLHDFKPIDVELDRLIVRGATGGTRVGVGEYRFEDLGAGVTAVLLFKPNDDGPAPRLGPGSRGDVVAERNPVMLARHAVTTCDLVIASEDDLAATIDLHGVVQELSTTMPVHGAVVTCGSQTATTDESGAFAFVAPVPWSDVLRSTYVACEGYQPFLVRDRSLPSAWVRKVHDDHLACFWLQSARPEAEKSPLPKLGR